MNDSSLSKLNVPQLYKTRNRWIDEWMNCCVVEDLAELVVGLCVGRDIDSSSVGLWEFKAISEGLDWRIKMKLDFVKLGIILVQVYLTISVTGKIHLVFVNTVHLKLLFFWNVCSVGTAVLLETLFLLNNCSCRTTAFWNWYSLRTRAHCMFFLN